MDLMVWKYRFGKEFDNKLMISGVTEKKLESCWWAEKSHVRKESGVTTQGRREVELGTLLLSNDKNNVIVENVLSYF